MKWITMSLWMVAMLFVQSVQAQSYNDDTDATNAAEDMMAYIDSRMDRLEDAIIARLDDQDVVNEYSALSLEMMFCYYDCMNAVKAPARMYYENSELLQIMYHGDDLDDATDQLEKDFQNQIMQLKDCACMMEE